MTNEEWDAAKGAPVTVTPQQVANIIHGMNRPMAREHHDHHSCPCMYWPDGKGGNAWEEKDEQR